MSAGPAVRVVLVDDHPAMRVAFRSILESSGVEVVGEAGDGDAALAVVARERPDVVLMDVRMPGRDGISATQALAGSHPDVRVVVLTTFDDEALLHGALVAGAAGFLLKNSPPEDVVRAVHTVARGDVVLDPAVTARVVRRFVSAPLAPTGPIEHLTEREKDVLGLLASGCSNAEIAASLGVGEATAKTHVSHVITKLGVRDRLQAVILAFETGFAPRSRDGH